MDYKYIRAWERIMGGLPCYLEMQLQKARAEGAPETAIHRRNDGTWATFEDIVAESTKREVLKIVAEFEKMEAQR